MQLPGQPATLLFMLLKHPAGQQLELRRSLLKPLEQIREFIRADSLGYLGVAGMMQASGRDPSEVCTACWTDEQPVSIPPGEAAQLRLFDKARR